MPDNTYELPNISIIIPFFSGLDILERTIASLTLQTYPKELWEAIVVEDGSQQATSQIVKRYSSQIRIRRLRQKRDGFRLSAVRNLGISNSSSTVILILDFDCVCLPNHIWINVREFLKGHKIATFGLRKFVDLTNMDSLDISDWIEELETMPQIRSISNQGFHIDKRYQFVKNLDDCAFPSNWFYGCNIGFLREDAMKIGLFDTEFDGNPGYEDIEFGYRLSQSGCEIVYLPEATVYHQENQVVGVKQRNRGTEANLPKLYSKVPGIRAYRQTLTDFVSHLKPAK